MEELMGNLDSIEFRHRKEKKELQAHVQALKKAAKNDKTKKKELTLEIARLESELEDRHKREIESLAQSKQTSDIVEEISNDVSKVKISKAQKRRDKKLQQEKERDDLIKLQEKENIHGPRNIEVQAIIAKLKKMGLQIFTIPSDGDCLYKAVSHQMKTKRQQTLSIEELRKKAASYIEQNKDDFTPFMSNPETCDMLTDVEFADYCANIVNTKVWGGQLEIRALSNSLKVPITVIQASGPDSIEQGLDFGGPPLIITYHRHMYSLGEHFNSTTILEEFEKE